MQCFVTPNISPLICYYGITSEVPQNNWLQIIDEFPETEFLTSYTFT